MEIKVVETKLRNVFNSADQNLGFDVNTPQFLKEACEGANGCMYAVCYNIFKSLLAQVAERATELHDPVLDALMIRLNLYEVAPKERYVALGKLAANYDAAIKEQKHQRLMEARKDATEALDKLNPQEPESIPVHNNIDELEKEIEVNFYPLFDGISFEDYRQIAKYFANWQREQMMQGALDAKVDTIKVEANADVVSYCVRYPVGQRNDNYESEVKVLVLKSEA